MKKSDLLLPWVILSTLWCVLCLNFSAEAQSASEAWTLKKCLEYGLKNHPSILGAEAAAKASLARIGSTKSGVNTKADVQSAFNHNRQEFRRVKSSSPLGGSDDTTDSTSNSLTVRKLITDSGQTTAKVNAARRDFDAAEAARFWNEISVAADIKSAYFRALQALAQVGVQQDLLRSYEVHLEKVRGYVDVGTRTPYDITKALVDVANTKVSLIKAESDARNMLSALAKTVGYEGRMMPVSHSGFLKLTQPKLDVSPILEEALSRPDILQIRFKLDAAQQRLIEAQRGMNPSLSTSAGYQWNGTASPLDRSWNVGVQLSVPVLDGRLTRYSIEEQRRAVEQVESTLSQSRLSIRAEVETAITDIRDAFQRLSASEVLLKQAAESLVLAEGRYDAGLGSPIEITDARAAFSSARGSHVAAYYDSLIALANLDRTLGIMPPEVGGVSSWTAGAIGTERFSEADIASVSILFSESGDLTASKIESAEIATFSSDGIKNLNGMNDK